MDRILILGGVAAGLSAASRVRRLAPDAQITVIERGQAAGYSACGLPYFLAGRVTHLDSLLAHPLETFRDQRRIDVRLGHEALEIEPARHRVRVHSEAGEQWLGYDRLVIATGARGRWLPAARRNSFAANTWAQTGALDAALRSGEHPRWAVVGGGYIGCEVAEALARRGVPVTLIEAHGSLLHGFEPEMVAELPARLEALGVQVRLGVRVQSFDEIAADAVVNCAGLQPEVGLAVAAGVAIGPTGAIAVDERQQTSLAAIFAAGDCAETRNLITGAPAWVPLATAANKQGRVAGANAAGGVPECFSGILATLAVPLAGMEWGRTGLTLAQARAAGYEASTLTVTGASRAGYLEPEPVTLQIVYDARTQRLLGCHMRGTVGTVAGRLDTAAAALAARMTLEQIEMLDLAYAPGLAPLYEPLLVAVHNARRA